jgi:hypothetical protein
LNKSNNQLTDNSVKKLKELYLVAKNAKVGDEVICPSCKTIFIKTNYQQAFCKTHIGTKCKDYYWNNVTPSKRNNTTRISPANATWQAKQLRERKFREGDEYEGAENLSGDALGQWDD